MVELTGDYSVFIIHGLGINPLNGRYLHYSNIYCWEVDTMVISLQKNMLRNGRYITSLSLTFI